MIIARTKNSEYPDNMCPFLPSKTVEWTKIESVE